MRAKSRIGCAVVLTLLCAPAGALAGNEAAPWSAPTWLDASETGGASASGVNLAALASGALVATWNEDLAGSTYPQLASEPFEGSWSAPDSLTTTPMQTPQDALGGVRTAVDTEGKFVSVWLTPSGDQNDVVGVSGTVMPGEQPTLTPHVFGVGYDQNTAPRGSSFQYPYTPQVAMSTNGTGSLEATAVDSNASPGTDKQIAAIEGGSPGALDTDPQNTTGEGLIRDNPVDGSDDYDKFIPQLAVAPLNADWTDSINQTEAMLATSNNYSTQYGSQTASQGENALLYTTSDPLDWYTLTPTVLPMLGELTAAGVLPNGNVIVANDADDLNGDWESGNYGISVWETGDTTAKVLDPDTGEPAGYPAVATFNDGSATIAYVDDDLADDNGEVVKEVTLSPDGQWSDPVTLWTAPSGAQVLDVTDAYGPDGTTYVVWDVLDISASSNEGLYASVRLPGGSFPTTPDTVYSGGASDPKIAVDQTDYATIVAAVEDPTARAYRIAAFTHANLVPPRLLTAPAISGTAKVGSTLACAGDSWLNRPTGFQVKWLRGTSPIAGATSRTYTLTSADSGQTLSCEVTATNAYGSALGQSPGVKVAVGSAKLSNVPPRTSSVGTSNGNSVSVTVSCPSTAASCAPVTVQITVIEVMEGNKVVAVIASKQKRKRDRAVVIGSTKVSLKPGQEKKITVRLNRAGESLLAHHPRLKVLFTVKAKSTKVLSRTLTLKRPKSKRK